MSNSKDSVAVYCKNVTKTFGEGSAKVEALRGISLEIHSGELRLLMGPSGSGKTTLISIIAGMLTQDSGECLVKGVDINHLSDKERTHFRGGNIGFVFQAFRLVPMITVEENICVPLLLNGIERKDALDKSKAILAEFGMGDKIGAFHWNFREDNNSGLQLRVLLFIILNLWYAMSLQVFLIIIQELK